MNKRAARLLAGLACIMFVVGLPSRSLAPPAGQVIYEEDFSSSPGFESTDELYSFWDAEGGSYVACSLDVNSGYGFYVGYSPEFSMVEGDFAVSVDFMVLAPDWGCYPAIGFQNTLVPDPDQPGGYALPMRLTYHWADDLPRRFMLWFGDSYLVTPDSPEVGVWYRITIVHHSANSTVDWRVEERDSGMVFHEVFGEPRIMETGFNRVYVGEISTPPKYGEHAVMRADNIVISQPSTSVRELSWGAIKSKYR